MSEGYASTICFPLWAQPTPKFIVVDKLSETELVERAQRGSVEAFEALYRQHVGRVYALCLRMVADPARAEDLAQESFVKAWQKLGSFRRRSSFGTWLHRLTVNLVLSELRRRPGFSIVGVDSDELEAMPDPVSQRRPGAGLDLEEAIQKLPHQARMVFLLHDVHGFLHREIGQIMRLATGTSKAHLHRARQILREELKS